MRFQGTMTSKVPPAELRRRVLAPDIVAAVRTLELPQVAEDGTIRAVVRPRLSLGGIAMITRIVPGRVEGRTLTLTAEGQGSGQRVLVDLEVDLDGDEGGTELAWRAEIRALGTLASAGQRVVGQVTARAITDAMTEVLAAVEEAA